MDETKRGRDLGAYLRQRVAQAFREGENTQIAEPEACDQMYESLARLHSNYYKHKYPRPRDTSFSGLSVEEYKLILSTDTLEEFQEMNSLGMVLRMNAQDVRALGITLMGHQKKILGSIQTMRAQLSSTQGPRRHL